MAERDDTTEGLDRGLREGGFAAWVRERTRRDDASGTDRTDLLGREQQRRATAYGRARGQL